APLVREGLPEYLTLVDLGEHPLRDVNRPIRVFQVVHPDLQREFPPLRSAARAAGNLPATTTSFVGRDDDVTAIGDLLGTARLVTLTGVGGVGKTRLAIEVA